MKKGKKRIVTLGVVAVTAIVFSLFTALAQGSTDPFEPTKEYWKVVKYEEVAAVRNNPKQLDGYVFAGWFKEESCDKSTALKQGDNSGPAYAKYVPEEVLGLKAQVIATLWDNDTTNDETGAIRFVTSVDSLDYARVGFIIQLGSTDGKENDKYSSTVYKTLFATIGGADGKQDTYHAWDAFHKSSRYFKAWTVTNIGAKNYGTEFYVTPYWKTLDGTTVKAPVSMKTVNGGRTWEYVFVDDNGADDIGAGTIGSPYKTLEKALSEMQTNKEIQIAANVKNVNMTGKVYVKESLTAPETGFTWNQHNLDITLTKAPNAAQKATVDFSALTNLNMGDAATFADMNLTFPKTTVYANGHRLEIAESVTATTTNQPKIFGGSGSCEVESTHVTLLSGNYANIYAGGENRGVAGDTYIYIGGTVNHDVLENTEKSLHNKNTGKNSLQIFGGSYNAAVSGDTHVTVGGSALINYVRGSGNGQKQVVTGTCYVNLQDNAGVYGINGGGNNGSTNNTQVVVTGGTVYQVQGGMTSAGGTVNNTSVQILGGTVGRRIYGGSYNEFDTESWSWASANAVSKYAIVTIGNDANLQLNDSDDKSLCAISRLENNNDDEIGILVLNSEKTNVQKGWAGTIKSLTKARYTDYLVMVETGGKVVSEGSVLRITPDSSSKYATVKKGEEILFQCQGEGTCPVSLFGEKPVEIQNITVTFSDSETLSGNYELSYGENSHSYFSTLSDVVAAVSTPKTSIDGVITQKTATITIGEEDCTVDATVVIDAGKNIVLQNKEGVTVTIKRGTNLTGTGEFVFDVVKGGSLTIGGTLVVDGNGVTGPSMIDNKGEFTLGENACLQNAKSSGNGAALFNRGGVANLYGNMTGNQAKQGGALANSGEVTIHSGTYSNNTSTAEGGVIYSATTGNKTTIKGGSFYGNTTKTVGGVVHCTGTLAITGGEYYNNTAATAGGAINIPYVNNVSQPATITGADIHDNSLTNSSNADVSVAGAATLNLKNNTSVGVVQLQGVNAAINVQEMYTGKMVLVPYNNDYTIGSKLVTFAKGTTGSAEYITVRKYASKTEWNDDAYCVDTAGTLQWKNPQAKIGETIYPTLAEAIAAAVDGDIVSVLKDIEVSGTINISDNKAITITNVSGKDVKLTRTGSVSMFTVTSGSTLTLGSKDTGNKLILDGGYIASAESPLTGANLVENQGHFILEENATIQNAHNTANGGALYNRAGTADLYGSMIGNGAKQGAAIANAGTVTIHDGIYSGNVSAGGDGGVIYSATSENKVIISGGCFSENETKNGTAGVVYCNGTLTITGGEYYDNKAVTGGGVVNVAGTATITNAIMHDNSLTSSTHSGGAIYVTGSKTLTLEKCNIYNNTSDYKSNTNPGADISLGGKTVLNLKDNTNVGVVHLRYATDNVVGTINVLAPVTGYMAVIPFNNTCIAGTTKLITFGNEEASNSASKIIVRIAVSKDSFDDATYYIDTEGTVQELQGVAKIGDTYYETLPEAIATAADGDTVYVMRDVEVSEAIAVDTNITITNASGRNVKLTRTGKTAMFTVASGRTLTIGSADKANAIILDGGNTETAPLVGASLISNAGTFTLEANATIQNANGGNTSSVVGGALNNAASATATIKGSIQGCSAYNGGAIYNAANGTVIVEEGAILSGNSAVIGNGGAIRNLGNLTITKATLENNMGIKGTGNNGNGGAVYNSGKLVATDVIFKGNSATSGGAIYNNIVSNSTAIMEIHGGMFVENSAVINTGGAIHNSGTSASITEAEFAKNSSGTNNSAAINAQKAITLTDCNIHDNVSSENSTNAVYDIQVGNATLNLAGDTKTGVVYRAHTSGRVNLLENFTGNITLVPNAYTAGTQIVTFAEGITDKAAVAGKIVVGKVISGQVVDNGKYYIDADGKLQAHTEAAKVGDTSYATLAEALASVTTEDPTTICLMNHADLNGVLAVGTAEAKRNITMMNLAGEDVTLTRAEAESMISIAAGSSLTIACSEGGTITLDGNSSLKTPHLIKNEGTFVFESGAVIQNAVTGGSKNEEPYNGGALYNMGSATLKGKFTGCSAFNGGAVFNAQNATMEVIGATFTENVTSGGNGGAIRNLGTLTVKDSKFESNQAVGNNGGAIYTNTADLEATNTSFIGNTASKSGGAIYADTAGTKCTINHCIFESNIAGGTGGAIRATNSLTITGGSYSGNKAATAGGAVDVAGTGTISGVTMYDNSLTNATNGGGAIYVPSGKKLTLSDSNIYNNASYEVKGTVQACDIYNAGAAANLTLSGIRADDENAETTEQCLVYQGGKLYYVDIEGNLQEDT